jgi:uncharacterized protein with PIN domain
VIYLDTSCLLKLIRVEQGSDAVAEAVARENEVLISTLGELEARIQLKAGYLGGQYTLRQWRGLEAEFEQLRDEYPFAFKSVPAAAWENALRQHHASRTIHCRTLDRLHLGIMECFGAKRLMTHDDMQAKAAEVLGFEVLKPGRQL